MKSKVDIYLGRTIWLVALFPLCIDVYGYLIGDSNPHPLGWAIPLPWSVMVIVLISITKGPLRKLVWVYLSALFAFYYWLHMMLAVLSYPK